MGQEGHSLRIELDVHICPLCHLEEMAKHAKAGDIGHGVDLIASHHIAGIAVECEHDALGTFHILIRCKAALRCGRGDADAGRLRVDENVPRPGASVGVHLPRIDESCDRKAVLRLCIIDRVSACDEGSCLVDLLIAAAQDLMHDLFRHVFWHGHDVQGKLRLSAHCIDV